MRKTSDRLALFRNLTTIGPVPRFLAFLVTYAAAYKVASLFAQTTAAPLWLPDSVLLCWLLASPRKQWWLYLITPLPVRLILTLPATVPLWFLFVTFANDSLKELLAAYLLRRTLGFPIRLTTLRAFSIFIAAAVIAAPLASSLAGAASRHALGYGFWISWYQWFLGNALASLVITPMLLFWLVVRHSAKRRLGELALLMLGLALVSYYAFEIPHTEFSPLLLYTPLPFLIWAVSRTGPAGTSAALSVLSIFSILSSSLGRGIFAVSSASHNLLSLQLFLLVVSIPLLFLAVVMEERQRIQADLRRTQKSVSESNERLRNLANRLINSQEEERRRIARELHDDIGQRLSLLINELDERQRVPLALGQAGPSEDLSQLHHTATQIATDIHDLSHELHSAKLHHIGLNAALKDLCQKVSPQRHISIIFRSTGLAKDLPADLALCLFRVGQEALNNVVKHSKASEAFLEVTQEQDVIALQVRDSGIGFDATKLTDGLGFSSMRERLWMFGGDLQVRSACGNGTEIVARVRLGYERKKAAVPK